MADRQNAANNVDVVRRLLGQIIRHHPDMRELVGEINKLIDGLPRAAREPIARRTGEGVRYEIRTVNRQPALYEVRPAGAPLRVGRDLFDAAVEVLATATRPLNYDEITEGIEARTGAALADWQGRVILRFLQQAEPPIVIRSRSRYRPVDPTRFEAAAKKRWDSTAKV